MVVGREPSGSGILDTEQILVVEDEPMLAAMLTELLRDEGYRVTCMTSAEEAARLIQSEGRDFQALVTDVNLRSGVDGFELASMLSREGRSAPRATVFMTGESARNLRDRAPDGAVFLEKPFRPSEIVGVLDQLLGQD